VKKQKKEQRGPLKCNGPTDLFIIQYLIENTHQKLREVMLGGNLLEKSPKRLSAVNTWDA
jgi:hypothetical protein